MNWDAMAAIGELVGAIAVVVSIVFLTLQVRSNTRAVRGRAAYDANSAWADVSEEYAFRVAPDAAGLVDLVVRVHEDKQPLSEMTTQEIAYLGQLWRSFMYRLEAQFWLTHHGLLERNQWDVRAQWLRGLIELPAAAAWWEAEKVAGLYSQEFVTALLDTPASVPSVAPVRTHGTPP